MNACAQNLIQLHLPDAWSCNQELCLRETMQISNPFQKKQMKWRKIISKSPLSSFHCLTDFFFCKAMIYFSWLLAFIIHYIHFHSTSAPQSMNKLAKSSLTSAGLPCISFFTMDVASLICASQQVHRELWNVRKSTLFIIYLCWAVFNVY